MQPDGKILVGRQFTNVNGQATVASLGIRSEGSRTSASVLISEFVLEFIRDHWSVGENGAHYRRDVSLGEDPSQISQRTGVQVMAIRANQKTKVTCELQVRTLMDEVWGEVSHRVNFNYPSESPSLSCQNQLKILARLTSGCTRLVDSIFQSHFDST